MKLIEIGAAAFAVGLFIGMMLIIEWGRHVGAQQRARIMAGGASGVSAVEAAIFALLGLLIAFTFQGASARFEARRALIVQEANNIGTAWLRIDLLPAGVQPGMRALFRQYLDSRLESYRRLPDLPASLAELSHTVQLQNEIWKIAVASQKEGSQVVVGFLPPLNAMFDIVTTRTMAGQTHPPVVVFVMLALMAYMAAFLAGHGMSGSQTRSWIHSFGFAATLAVTVYVIVDMEYPRLGLIRVDSFDQVLVELRQSMQ